MSALEAGRELDALVAERIFGLVPCQSESHQNGIAPWSCHAQPDSPDRGAETKCYSTDIAAAWEVVEAMRARGIWIDVETLSHLYEAHATRAGTDDEDHIVWLGQGLADTAPLAICEAALAAVAP